MKKPRKKFTDMTDFVHDNAFIELGDSIERKSSEINRFSNKSLVRTNCNTLHFGNMQLDAVHMYNLGLLNLKQLKEIIYRISIHDLDECVSADIPRDLKYYDEKILYEVKRVTKELLLESNFKRELISEMDNAKDHSCIEGWVVTFLDIMDASITLYNEYQLQHLHRYYIHLQDNYNYLVDFLNDFHNWERGQYVKLREYIDSVIKGFKIELDNITDLELKKMKVES